jgi:hypothetical protein
VQRADFTHVMTIAQSVEAAIEILEFSMPARYLEWSEDVVGPRPKRVHADAWALLEWLSRPKPTISKRIMSTEQAHVTTAATCGRLLLAQRWNPPGGGRGE